MGDNRHHHKEMAVREALQSIKPGMIVGLGHGSTAMLFVRDLAKHLRSGQLADIRCIPCSKETEAAAQRLDIPLTTFETNPVIDVTVDGTDEITPELDMIKGGGGALLREKIVAQASRREIIVADETKLSPVLGLKRPIPIEVIPFGLHAQTRYIKTLGGRPVVRRLRDRTLFVTDQENFIIDCHFDFIPDLNGVAEKLSMRAGIVEHGLFLGLATEAIIAGPGGIRRFIGDPRRRPPEMEEP